MVPTANSSALAAIDIDDDFKSCVRDAFQDNLQKYANFLKIVELYKDQRISFIMFTVRVRELFRGYPQLLLGFNTFLPEGNKIELPFNDLRCAKELEGAIRFFVKVKSRFSGPDVYRNFVSLLELYHVQHMSLNEISEMAAVFFKGQQDLLEDFIHLMSDCSGGAHHQHSLSGRYLSLVGAYVGSLSQTSIDELKIHMAMPTDDARIIRKSDVEYFLKRVKDAFSYKREKYVEFMDTLDKFRQTRIGFRVLTLKLRELFRGHSDLLLGLNILLLERFLFFPAYDQRQRTQEKPIVHEDAIDFLNKVKPIFDTAEPIDYAAMRQKYNDAGDYMGHVENAFQDCRGKYDDLLTILSCYCFQRIDLSMCASRVREMFRGHPDLLLGFNAFLPKHCEVVLPLVDSTLSHKIPLEPEDASHFIEKAKSCFKNDEKIYNSLIDIIGIHSGKKVLWSNDCLQVVRLIRNHHDLLIESSNFLYPNLRTSTKLHRSLASSRSCNERNFLVPRTKICACCLLYLMSCS